MKKVGILGTNGTVNGAAFLQTNQLVDQVGQNTGNMVFQYAAHRLIKSEIRPIGPVHFSNPKAVKDQVDILVVPSANFIREGVDMTSFADFLERCELPLVFLGLGAQAESMDTAHLSLHPSLDRLIALMKERSKKISVRGEFTARVLEGLGIINVSITGCPSNFINSDADLGQKIVSKAAQNGLSFITHAEEPWPKNPKKTEVERRLINWTRNGRGMMIQQSVPRVIELLRQRNSAATQLPRDEFEEKLRRQLSPDIDRDEFRDFIAHKLRNYVSVEQWMEDSARFDFSIGMRLHGNMAAWQAGTPSLWIHHDARTRELVETMALPSVSLEAFLSQCHTLGDARAVWSFDEEKYTKRRAELRKKLYSVLTAHDVDPIAS